MSILLEMSMFPTDHGESKSEYVAQVISLIRDSGYPYQMTPMATIIETDTMREALEIAAKCHDVLESLDCNRVYATLKFDMRKGHNNRLKSKVDSVERHIGEVSK